MSSMLTRRFRSTGGSTADEAAAASDRGRSEPTSHPLRVTVSNGFNADGHAKYIVSMHVPSLDKRWAVEYRFANFRDVNNACRAQCPTVDLGQFPVTHRRRSLGIPLSDSMFRERTVQLDAWVKSLVRQRPQLNQHLQDIVAGFLNLEQLGDFLDLIVVQDGAAAVAEITDGAGGGGAATNGAALVPPTPAAVAASTSTSVPQTAIPVANAVPMSSAAAAASTESTRSLTVKDATKKKNLLQAPHWKTLTKKLLLLGVPVVQHKYRKSKMGALSTRPRILRISPDMTDLHLVAPNEGGDWIVAGQVSLRSVHGLTTGGEGSSTLAASFRKRGGEYASLADARAFTILAGELQWDLEISVVYAETAWGAITCDSPVVDEEMPPTLRDQIAGYLDELIRDMQARENERAEFQACPRFKGRQEGYVFKTGDKGLGYYKDRPPMVSAAAGKRR